ncbi:MAG TPA: hypothetical protein VNJ46_00955 [Gaiellaceae bacterium]|nr:hypothetical protein [Gaiellaceae bacterium]
MIDARPYRHGGYVHAHVNDRAHRHLLHPRRSIPGTHAPDHVHGHADALIDPTIKRSRAGLQAVSASLLVLGLTAAPKR